MTIDITHNGTHILNESDVCNLIDKRDELAAVIDWIQQHCRVCGGEGYILVPSESGDPQPVACDYCSCDIHEGILAARDRQKMIEGGRMALAELGCTCAERCLHISMGHLEDCAVTLTTTWEPNP